MGMLFAVAITEYPTIASSKKVERGETILSGKLIPTDVMNHTAPDSIEMDIRIEPDYYVEVKSK
ncbi:hypothetical protein [Sporosarcina gallistercoris]|uniref:Uncharacterized protein n=1 Tax=Sporosarcina gallistercoris TaxID=2762245 RepID=A0ABR8PKS3_9BACL|nr:hypothetical protein [Sporosarcina gallistercoris]MBD7908760.1 hypothetical protein [Sporosarcina gallistercoris]